MNIMRSRVRLYQSGVKNFNHTANPVNNCFQLPRVIFLLFGYLIAQPLAVIDGEPPRQPADNSRCFVCHLNYEEEFLAAKHAAANVGCIKCHGVSSDHAADEDHATAPDIIYSRQKIRTACLKCHAGETWESQHKGIKTEIDSDEKVCTDCHGDHRLKIRSRRWDKSTRELVPKSDSRP